MDQHDYNMKKVAPLIGATITGLIETPFDDDINERSFGFRCVKEGKTYDAWIDRDEEANGPGHVNVIDVTNTEEKYAAEDADREMFGDDAGMLDNLGDK